MENKNTHLPKDLLPQHFVDADQKQVSKDEVLGVKDSVVALYFSASWCPPCVRLSPQLVAMYKLMKESGKKLEIILVCDQSKEEAEKYFSHMPWLSIPHDQPQIKKKLFELFEVSGIPTLILFDGETGNKISSEGIQLMFEHGPDAFPWTDEKIKQVEQEQKQKMSSKTFEEMFTTSSRNYLINNKGEQFPVSSIQKDVIGIYFSAHWCPPCKTFTPVLIDVYNELKAQDKSFEVVFLSSDASEAEFKSYFATMPWLSIPFSDTETKKDLSNFYLVQGIPTLVLIHGRTGKLISVEGRSLVATYKAPGFGWTEERLAELKAQEDEKMRSEPKTLHVKAHDHPVSLLETIYDGAYGCDACGVAGGGWVYHCDPCGYDMHPACAKKSAK